MGNDSARHFHGIEDLEAAARRRLPRVVNEYIAGGASSEFTIAENRRAYDRVTFSPLPMVDISTRSTAVTVLGQRLALPVIAGPAGLAPLVHPQGEKAVARAAAAAGSVFCISNASGFSLEEIAAAAPGPLWFQLFSCTERTIAGQFVARAREARCQALILGVDLPIGGLRYRDDRNGMRFPPRPKPRDLLDFLWHPRWLWNAATSGRISLGNYTALLNQLGISDSYSFLTTRVLQPTCSWDDLRWLRGVWDGPIVVKGIMSPEAAVRAQAAGANAVVVSNHGGRQLDWLPATIDVLPEVVDAVGAKIDVLMDGGVRHGADVVKALALGAKACLVARPWYWSLAADGEAGVAAMFDTFRHEIDTVAGLLGCPRIAEVTSAFIRRREPLPRPATDHR